MSTVARSLSKILMNPKAQANAQALVEALLAEWGGPAGVANELRLEYQNLGVKHPSRVKILTLIIHALLKFSPETVEEEESLEQAQVKLAVLREALGADADDISTG